MSKAFAVMGIVALLSELQAAQEAETGKVRTHRLDLTDPAVVRPRPFLEAVFSLEADGPEKTTISLAQEIIVGLPATKGSTIRLRPGDTVMIRMPGSLLRGDN